MATSAESLPELGFRLVSLATVAKALTEHGEDLSPADNEQLRRYIAQLPLPVGWSPARFDDPTLQQPLRMATHARPDGGWDGFETLAVLTFTGTPPSFELLRKLTEHTLHDFGAEGIATSSQQIPQLGRRTDRVRCSGEIALTGQRAWLQYTVYLPDTQPPEVNIVIEHTIVVIAARRADLSDDITALSNRCYGAVASIRDAIREPEAQAAFEAEVPFLRIQPYDDMGIASILANANRNGMRLLNNAVQTARANGESSFTTDGVTHRIIQQPNAAQLDIAPGTVVWRFDEAKISELLEMLEPLIIFWDPAHNYLDLDIDAGPIEQLVIAVDEYVGTAPYGEFPELQQS